MKPTQPTLPTLPDFRQAQTVTARQLDTLIAQGTAAGFRATGLAVTPTGYRVTFERIGRPSMAGCSKGSPAGVLNTGDRDRIV
jgi:hypothetical protein